VERTLVLIKPDGVQRGLIFTILARLEARGLKLAGLKLVAVSESLAQRHYAVHQGKPFYEGLIRYIASAPVVAAVFEGTRAVSVVRSSVGSTNAAEAAPGTIRGDLAIEIGRNLVHASDSPENGEKEIALWFEPTELVSWSREVDMWVFE
jgi:nucleoside-diphosphate kinase